MDEQAAIAGPPQTARHADAITRPDAAGRYARGRRVDRRWDSATSTGGDVAVVAELGRPGDASPPADVDIFVLGATKVFDLLEAG